MPCTYKCGIEHGYSEPCAHQESPFFDESLARKVIRDSGDNSGLADEIDQDIHEVLVGPLSQAERNARWREKNRDKYNAYMRSWRRRKRDGG